MWTETEWGTSPKYLDGAKSSEEVHLGQQQADREQLVERGDEDAQHRDNGFKGGLPLRWTTPRSGTFDVGNHRGDGNRLQAGYGSVGVASLAGSGRFGRMSDGRENFGELAVAKVGLRLRERTNQQDCCSYRLSVVVALNGSLLVRMWSRSLLGMSDQAAVLTTHVCSFVIGFYPQKSTSESATPSVQRQSVGLPFLYGLGHRPNNGAFCNSPSRDPLVRNHAFGTGSVLDGAGSEGIPQRPNQAGVGQQTQLTHGGRGQQSNVVEKLVGGLAGTDDRAPSPQTRSVGRQVEALEPRYVLAVDYGDAPDTGAGTGRGNYETLSANGGPSHTIVAGLFLGAHVDGEANATTNAAANGDDITTSPDDEDGVAYPQSDLVLTVGTQPTVTLRATNKTGANATLFGWIDFNADGAFDSLTERTSTIVQTGTNNGLFTLVFPVVPAGFTGATYARFRLSADVAAGSPVGAASSGEIEDYAATILVPSDGTVKTTNGVTKLASGTSGVPTLGNFDYFGRSVTALGDVDGDGVGDVAVGASGDDTGGYSRGAVYVLLMQTNGTVKSSRKIASGTNGGPTLANYDGFGRSVAALGDFDGDGVGDIAVGASGDNTGGSNRGAVYVLRLNADGTVKSSTKLASGTGGGPVLANPTTSAHP